ncbi:hypothetical protein GCM10027400_26350 [Pseudoxanthomonas daejeonensis]
MRLAAANTVTGASAARTTNGDAAKVAASNTVARERNIGISGADMPSFSGLGGLRRREAVDDEGVRAGQ